MKKILGASVSLCVVFVAVAAIAAQAPATKTVWDGVYATEQAERGAKLFEQRCAGCHGADMRGGAGVPGVAGIEFMAAWGNQTAWAVFDTMKGSMPADNPGGLTDEQYTDVLAAIFRANEFPAGLSPLAAGRADLEAIRIIRKP
jgi:mono/diheme cytochrome c family protein